MPHSNSVISISLLCASLVFFGKQAQAQAQQSPDFSPPNIKLQDDFGVNLISGLLDIKRTLVKLGQNNLSLSFTWSVDGSARRPDHLNDDFYSGIYRQDQPGVSTTVVKLLGQTESFYRTQDGTNAWMSARNSGASLTALADGSYKYVDRNGVIALSDPKISGHWPTHDTNPGQAITKITFPDGRIYQMHYVLIGNSKRIITIGTNFGIYAKYKYNINAEVERITLVNGAVDYCDPLATDCSYSKDWPSVTFANEVIDADTNRLKVTTPDGVVSVYANSRYFGATQLPYWRTTSIKSSDLSVLNTFEVSYANTSMCNIRSGTWWDCSDLRPWLVKRVSKSTEVREYSFSQPAASAPPYSGANSIWKASTKNINTGFETAAEYRTDNGSIRRVDSLDGSQTYDVASPFRLLNARDSVGKNFEFKYDSRGNTTEKKQISSDPNIPNKVMSAGYDSLCSSFVKCNKPNWTKDARGSITDFLYDDVHGGILKETLPADTAGVRPQKRYVYGLRYAWVKSSSGAFVKESTGIWLPTAEFHCVKGSPAASGNGCQAGAGVLVKTEYGYGPDSGPNNLWLRGKTLVSGSTSLRTCYLNDDRGNVIAETSPRANRASCI